MSRFQKLNERFNQKWSEIGKRLLEASASTRVEAAGATAEVLKNLAKELSALGTRLDRFAETGGKQDPSVGQDATSGAE